MKKIKGWLIKQKVDSQGDFFDEEGCKNIKKQIKDQDPIFFNFNTNEPPIGKVISVKYIKDKGIEIEAEVYEPTIPLRDFDIRIGGYYKDFEMIDGIRIIKNIEFVECSLVPKFASVYEEEE